MDTILENIFAQLNDLRKRVETLEGKPAKPVVPAEDDPLLPEAIKLVQQHDKVSASLLQRRLSIGYARAARMLDQIEAKGIIGPGKGAEPRDVLKKDAG